MIHTLRDQFEELDLQLIEARKAIRTREYILSLMESLDRQLAEKRRELSLLAAQVADEKQDIEVLEGYTVEALVSAVLGRKEQQLQKETAEYWQIQLYYDKCQKTISTLEARLTELEEQLVGLADCEELYEHRLNQRDQLVAQLALPESIPFLAVSNTLSTQRKLCKNLQEAIQTGYTALDSLHNIQYSLENDGRYPLPQTTTNAKQHLEFFAKIVLSVAETAPNLANSPLNSGLLTPQTIDEWVTWSQQARAQVREQISLLQKQLEQAHLSIHHLKAEREVLIRQMWHQIGHLLTTP